MKLYNVEVFDQDFNFLFNTAIEEQKYEEDYLDPEKSKLKIPSNVPIKVNSIIRLYNETYEYFGIVGEVKEKDDGTTEISYTSVEGLFDQEILINVDEITGTYEQYIKACIDGLYVTNPDLSQRLPLSVTAVTSTNSWDFDYDIENEPKDDDDEPPVHEVAFVKILDDLIIPAFKIYGIVIYWTVDIPNKIINVEITKNTDAVKTIETDMPNIIDKKITIRKVKKRINKVNIWNKKDFERKAVYYLHSDDTFDEIDTDRVTPVVYKNQTVSTDNNETCISKKVKTLKSDYSTIKSWNRLEPEERTEEELAEAQAAMADVNEFVALGWTYNSTDGYFYDANNIKIGEEDWGDDEDGFIQAFEAWASTPAAELYGEVTAADLFQAKADAKALSNFSKNKYDNCIEIEVANDDERLDPTGMKIGQVVHVIENGISYETVLTAREIEETTTLIFGFIRLELTKILKGRS